MIFSKCWRDANDGASAYAASDRRDCQRLKTLAARDTVVESLTHFQGSSSIFGQPWKPSTTNLGMVRAGARALLFAHLSSSFFVRFPRRCLLTRGQGIQQWRACLRSCSINLLGEVVAGGRPADNYRSGGLRTGALVIRCYFAVAGFNNAGDAGFTVRRVRN
jgi:hypothetical protein